MGKGGATMITVYDVADYYLSKAGNLEHKKLQKLCYYAYSWSLVLLKKPMFDQKFEAWVHGPVCPALYHKYKNFGWMSIPFAGTVSEEITKDSNSVDLLDTVYNTYAKFTGDELEELTHQEQPWIQARDFLEPHQPSNVTLDDTLIINFYTELYANGQNE